MPQPKICFSSTVPEVQAVMNAAVGAESWPHKDSKWTNLMEARNYFIRNELARLGVSPRDIKTLSTQDRRHRISILEDAFTREFFPYSRRWGWMAAAVGEDEAWIHAPGLRTWMVKWALRTVEHDRRDPSDFLLYMPAAAKLSSSAPSGQVHCASSSGMSYTGSGQSYDAVRDSAQEHNK